MASPRAEAPQAPAAPALPVALLALLVDRLNVGIVTVSAEGTVQQWNRFLHAHTRVAPEEVVGRNLYERFPELPRPWLEQKLRSVFLLKNFAFTSWRQRPYLFKVEGHRPLTGGGEPMRQDCAFIPLVHDGVVKAVSIVIIDATDTYESQTRLDETLAALAAQSERDALTGVYNRRKLSEVLDTEIQRARRYHQPLVGADVRHRPLQARQRHLRPPGRRRRDPARGQDGGQHPARHRLRRPLRRRGVRRAPARRGDRRGRRSRPSACGRRP